MRSAHIFALFCVACLLIAAQAINDRPAIHVDIASPVRIFNNMKETKDLRAKQTNQARSLDSERIERASKIRDLQTQRDRTNNNDPKWQDLSDQLRRASIELETWQKVAKADLEQTQKQQIKKLFDKIAVAIEQVAKSRGTELVLAEQNPAVPENMESIDISQLRTALMERNVLYSAQTLDISDLVITHLDASYTAPK